MIRNEILIGRQNLKEKIVDLYNENNDKNILLVKGPSGIGKSYAIQHLTNDYRELNQVTCKAYQQHIAEFTLIKDLLNKLMELILVLPSKDFNPLVYQMKHTLSSELEYIAFLSERARKIFVDIKPRTFINYEGQKYKVRKALSHFFKAVCNNIDHVFIHLDDIQWVDDNSLDLIKTLLKVKSLNASFILSYRDEFLGMSKEEKIYDLVTLSPLTIVEIEEVLSKSIDSNLSDLGYLTKHIYSTTLGIPFYIAKVMDELIEKQIIELDEKPQIHIDQLTKVNISENLNEIMLSRVSELTESEKLFLEYLSCLEGNVSKVYFDAIFPLKSDQMVTNLLDKSFIFVTDQRYCFTHDIIFEYIYQQIDPVERESIYTVIANNLCRYYEDDKDLWPLLVSAIVKIKNRNWCQKRGEQWFEILSEASNHTINYKTTRDILMVCKEIMVAYPNLYKNDILIKLAKCHYLLGEIQCAKSLYTFLENKADTKSALLNIEDQRMNMYTFVGHHDKAMETGKKMLKLLGLEYDIRGRDAIIKALGDQDNLNFLDTWHFSKPSQGEINREYILYKMIPSSKFVGPHHFDYCMLLLSSSVYERPEGKYKIFALTAYAFVLFNILNKYTLAKQCSDFILNHLDFDSEDEMIQETIAFYLTFVHHWSNDLEDTIEYLQKNNTICLEEGIITHFNYSLASLMFAYTSVGGNILTVAKNLNQRIELLDVLSVEERQFINTFVTMTLKRYIDVLNRCGAVALEERPVVIQEVVVIWFSILASYINGHIREAYKAIKQLQGYFSEVKGHIVYPDMMCFSTLIMLENHGNLSCQDQTLDRELIDANRLYLKNITDDYAKNHQGRYYLVEGMYQSVFGKAELAIGYFNKSLKLSTDQSNYLLQVIGCRLAGYCSSINDLRDFYRTRGKQAFQFYISDWDSSQNHENLNEVRDLGIEEFLSDLEGLDEREAFKTGIDFIAKCSRSYYTCILLNKNNVYKLAYEKELDMPVEDYYPAKSILDNPLIDHQLVVMSKRLSDVIIKPKKDDASRVCLAVPIQVIGVEIGILYMETDQVRQDEIIKLTNRLIPYLVYKIDLEGSDKKANKGYQRLTPREIEILTHLSNGESNHGISEIEFISVGTVKSHLNSIYAKLGVNNRRKAIIVAKEEQII